MYAYSSVELLCRSKLRGMVVSGREAADVCTAGETCTAGEARSVLLPQEDDARSSIPRAVTLRNFIANIVPTIRKAAQSRALDFGKPEVATQG